MKYFTKLSEKVHYKAFYGKRAKNNPKARPVASGIFAGSDDVSGYKDRGDYMWNLYLSNLGKGYSMLDLRKDYLKKFPDDFIDLGIKYEVRPRFNKREKGLYERGVKHPRVFFRVGPVKGESHKAFYEEMYRGLYDREVAKLPDRDKRKVFYP